MLLYHWISKNYVYTFHIHKDYVSSIQICIEACCPGACCYLNCTFRINSCARGKRRLCQTISIATQKSEVVLTYCAEITKERLLMIDKFDLFQHQLLLKKMMRCRWEVNDLCPLPLLDQLVVLWLAIYLPFTKNQHFLNCSHVVGRWKLNQKNCH